MMYEKFYLEPAANQRQKSFYKKAYVERIGEWLELYSYGTKICSYNPFSKELVKTWAYNYSMTTKRHQKAFFEKYGINVIDTTRS